MIKKNSISLRYSLLMAIICLLSISCESEKTAYADNTELIQAYQKMEDAKSEFEARNEMLSLEFDSIALNFQKKVQSYQQRSGEMSQSEREIKEKQLMELGQRLERDQQQKKNKLEEESASVAEELVKEVRRKVATYGEENNYVYIYGSNETANILYAKEGKDITEELIEYINK